MGRCALGKTSHYFVVDSLQDVRQIVVGFLRHCFLPSTTTALHGQLQPVVQNKVHADGHEEPVSLLVLARRRKLEHLH